MAKRNYDKHIRLLDEKIAKCRATMDELLGEREQLVKEKKENEVAELYNLINEKGLSVEDAKKIILSDSEEEAPGVVNF